MSQGIKEKESFKLEKVKERVRTAFELRVEIVIAKIETAEKINKLLSPEQFNWCKN